MSDGLHSRLHSHHFFSLSNGRPLVVIGALLILQSMGSGREGVVQVSSQCSDWFKTGSSVLAQGGAQ